MELDLFKPSKTRAKQKSSLSQLDVHMLMGGIQHAFDSELGLSVHQLKYMLTANERYAVPCSLATNGTKWDHLLTEADKIYTTY